MSETQFVAFEDYEVLCRGAAPAVVERLWGRHHSGSAGRLLVFEEETGAQTDFALHGSLPEALACLAEHPLLAKVPPRTGPGRPKLGVVSREVSLLPRHWSWLESQPGGISGTLRRLVEAARHGAPDQETFRVRRDAVGRVMWALAGDLPQFEEASRALFAGELARLAALIETWPVSLRRYLLERLGSSAGEG